MADFNGKKLANGKTAWTVDLPFTRYARLRNSSAIPAEEVRIILDVAIVGHRKRMTRQAGQDFLFDTSRGSTLVTYELAGRMGLPPAGPTTTIRIHGALTRCYRGEIRVLLGGAWHRRECFFPRTRVPDMQNRLGMRAILDRCIIGISKREVTVFCPCHDEPIPWWKRLAELIRWWN